MKLVLMSVFYDREGPGRWLAYCGRCGWSRRYDTETLGREAAAQHLNAKRADKDAHRPKCPTPYKQRHPTKERAQAHIGSLYQHGRGNPDYAPYECRCGWWHIGHDPKKLERRTRRALAMFDS